MATKKNSNINGKEYYRIRRKVGEEIVGGKRKNIMKSFYGTSKRNAEKKYEEWKDEQRNSSKFKYSSDSTLGYLAEYYVENVLKLSTKYAEGTRVRYAGSYNNYVKNDIVLIDIKVCDIRPIDVQLFYNRLDCTQSTVKAVHKFMAAFFRWLSLSGYCDYILNAVEIPLKENGPTLVQEVSVWTIEELDIITNNLTNYRLRFFIIVAISTGLRIGELFGLKYSDFGKVLKVERQYQWEKTIPPKYNSYREIPLHPMVLRELEVHRKWHEAEMEKMGYKTDFIFTTQYGTLLEYGNVRRSINRYYKRIGVEAKKFHTYRSTFCTNLCRAGVPIQVASKLMGHKSIEVTAKHYTAIGYDEKQIAINALPDLTAKN
ncbi:MAG: site-specific integrase [Anaerovoracaceae bacterium]|uniref:tyrosine-type recombinase/integrase n=1 Tax=Chryseobacterium sp. TaxID=1871047 RepID=UPI002FC7172F